MEPSVAAIITGAAAVIGVVASKLWDAWRDRRRGAAEVQTAEIVDASTLRAELWRELELRDQRIDQLQAALDTAKREALDLLRKYNQLEVDHTQLKHEHEALQARHDELHARLATAVAATE